MINLISSEVNSGAGVYFQGNVLTKLLSRTNLV